MMLTGRTRLARILTMPRRTSPEDIDAVREAYADGHRSAYSIAKVTAISYPRVIKIMEVQGLPQQARDNTPKPERDAEIIKRYKELDNLAAVGREFDLTRERVRQIVSRGVPAAG